MALINCPECGHQMSDTAKKCPNCGAPLKKSPFKVERNIVISSLLLIVALGLLIGSIWIMCNVGYFFIVVDDVNFYLSMGLFIGSFIPLYCGLKMLHNKLKKSKLIFWLSPMIFILTMGCVFLIRGCGTRENHENRWEEWRAEAFSNSTTNDSAEESEECGSSASNSSVGEYEFVDSDNNTWVLILNEDETANLHVKNGRENYGTWEKWIDDIIWIRIPYEDAPRLNMKGDASPKSSLFINADYIYDDGTASKSKNPRMRLSIKKNK